MKKSPPPLLDETEIEAVLLGLPELAEYWRSPAPLLLIRGRATREDPIYEIQLAYDLGDRLETWRWLWVDAIGGKIVRQFPP